MKARRTTTLWVAGVLVLFSVASVAMIFYARRNQVAVSLELFVDGYPAGAATQPMKGGQPWSWRPAPPNRYDIECLIEKRIVGSTTPDMFIVEFTIRASGNMLGKPAVAVLRGESATVSLNPHQLLNAPSHSLTLKLKID